MSNGVEMFCLVCGADFKLMIGGAMSPARPGYCSTKCRYDKEIAEKRQKYERDEFVVESPPVCTAAWGTNEWIDFIDRCGEWL